MYLGGAKPSVSCTLTSAETETDVRRLYTVMGEKSATYLSKGAAYAAEMVEALTPVGDVQSKAMFGGFGIFENGTMFALVNREGHLYFRVDSDTRARYEDAGSRQHGRAYCEVPENVVREYSVFIDWAKDAAQTAHAAKKRHRNRWVADAPTP